MTRDASQRLIADLPYFINDAGCGLKGERFHTEALDFFFGKFLFSRSIRYFPRY